jgi:hypothetical protein
MRKKLLLTLTGALLLIAAVAAQETKEEKKEKKVLKNADIVLMVQNHFDDETLVKIIEVSDTDFDLSADALVALKNQGVSAAVLRAMLQSTQRRKLAAVDKNPSPPGASGSSADSTKPGGDSSNVSATSPPAENPAPSDKPPTTNTPATTKTPAPSNSKDLTSAPPSSSSGMDISQPQMSAMQMQMSAMGMGNFFNNMFSMNYTAEQLPHVYLLDDQVHRERHEVTASTAQIAQTKYKSGAPSAGETALRNLAQQGLSFAAMAGGPGAMMAMSAFSMASGFMPGMRPGTPSMTYVWGLPGRKSTRELSLTDPIFELSYGDIPGVDPDAFEPAIVKLFQTPDNYRVVGATRVKLNAKNMMSGGAPENGKWITEDRWPTRVYKEDRGFYVLRVDQPLQPGEYAVVLRPVKGYKATPSGLGGHAQVFYSVWDFSVPGATPEDTTKKKKK